jgi:GlcNAc-P-P-Und epimerase
MKKKILITGGSGFIGTNIINNFIRKGHQVLNVDIMKPKISSHNKNWRELDIKNYKALLIVTKEFMPDYILHLAARTDLNGKCIDEYSSNILGTENIVKICKKIRTIKRVIFTSSMLVNAVGSTSKGFLDYNPDTSYGESKAEMEKIILNSNLKIQWIIIRPTSIWGPWFGEPYSKFFYFVTKGLFLHPGDRACSKTYGFIDNSVFQISKLLFSKKKSLLNGKIFYIGDKPPINISNWADEISMHYRGTKNKKVYYCLFKLAALAGDFLNLLNISFPITSFRLKNMTTNNILPLDDLYNVTGKIPFTRLQGTKKTLKWIKSRG